MAGAGELPPPTVTSDVASVVFLTVPLPLPDCSRFRLPANCSRKLPLPSMLVRILLVTSVVTLFEPLPFPVILPLSATSALWERERRA